ncbi:MAG: hypothetical protein H6834_09270 [Planctomycetes bacterium]|nr:hypothetical protein [Planctomycetota bacterium]
MWREAWWGTVRGPFIGATLIVLGCAPEGPPEAAEAPLELEGNVQRHAFDLRAESLTDWTLVEGSWVIEHDAEGARVVQVATDQAFPRILLPIEPVRDVDVSLRFQARSGTEDASAGIVFRASEDRYYVVRANCLENNFRLYLHDGDRRSILAGTRIAKPALHVWHTLRVTVSGSHVQAFLDGELLLSHDGLQASRGRVGLWTKADAVTAFRDLVVVTSN